MRRFLAAAAFPLLGLSAVPAMAEPGGVTRYEIDGTFDDAAFALETAIIDRGLVIDHVSHVGEMLERTADDVGATAQVYRRADVYLFCSATLSRRMMEADPANIAHCPYSLFLYELADAPGTVHVGYPTLPEGPMREVQALLDEIAREAASLD